MLPRRGRVEFIDKINIKCPEVDVVLKLEFAFMDSWLVEKQLLPTPPVSFVRLPFCLFLDSVLLLEFP